MRKRGTGQGGRQRCLVLLSYNLKRSRRMEIFGFVERSRAPHLHVEVNRLAFILFSSCVACSPLVVLCWAENKREARRLSDKSFGGRRATQREGGSHHPELRATGPPSLWPHRPVILLATTIPLASFSLSEGYHSARHFRRSVKRPTTDNTSRAKLSSLHLYTHPCFRDIHMGRDCSPSGVFSLSL